MTELQNHIQPGPVTKRLKVLDALRGFALLGVCLANYKELTLYAFYDVEHTTNVEVSMMDQIANFLMYLLGAALGVYLFEVACAFLWLKCFAYGPLEWIWRMLTYGKRLPLKVRKL